MRDVVHRASRPTPRAPASGKPCGPGEFGPSPSAFGLGRTSSTTAPKPSILTRIPSGRTIPANHERLWGIPKSGHRFSEKIMLIQENRSPSMTPLSSKMLQELWTLGRLLQSPYGNRSYEGLV